MTTFIGKVSDLLISTVMKMFYRGQKLLPLPPPFHPGTFVTQLHYSFQCLLQIQIYNKYKVHRQEKVSLLDFQNSNGVSDIFF